MICFKFIKQLNLIVKCYRLIKFNISLLCNFRYNCKSYLIIFRQIKTAQHFSFMHRIWYVLEPELHPCEALSMWEHHKYRNDSLCKIRTPFNVTVKATVNVIQCYRSEACSSWWTYYKQMLTFCLSVINFCVPVWWLTTDQLIILIFKKCHS